MAKKQYIEQLFNTIGQLRKLLESQSQESHEEKIATMMQFSALKYLSEKEKSTVGDLAQHLRLSKSSATQLIERLEKSKFVKRVNDQKDRRVVRVSITSSGTKQAVNLKKKYTDKLSHVLSKVSEADLKELVRIHTKIIEALQEKG